MNPPNTSLELEVSSVDQPTVETVEKNLQKLQPKRWKETRDLATIITIAAGVVELINGLLELKEKLSKQKDAPEVTVRNPERDELKLSAASKEQLIAFINSAGSPS